VGGGSGGRKGEGRKGKGGKILGGGWGGCGERGGSGGGKGGKGKEGGGYEGGKRGMWERYYEILAAASFSFSFGIVWSGERGWGGHSGDSGALVVFLN